MSAIMNSRRRPRMTAIAETMVIGLIGLGLGTAASVAVLIAGSVEVHVPRSWIWLGPLPSRSPSAPESLADACGRGDEHSDWLTHAADVNSACRPQRIHAFRYRSVLVRT